MISSDHVYAITTWFLRPSIGTDQLGAINVWNTRFSNELGRGRLVTRKLVKIPNQVSAAEGYGLNILWGVFRIATLGFPKSLFTVVCTSNWLFLFGFMAITSLIVSWPLFSFCFGGVAAQDRGNTEGQWSRSGDSVGGDAFEACHMPRCRSLGQPNRYNFSGRWLEIVSVVA